MLRKPEEARELLNYVSLSGPHKKSNWRQKILRCFSGVTEELSSFWSFFWRWLLVFFPLWAFFIGIYWRFSSGT